MRRRALILLIGLTAACGVDSEPKTEPESSGETVDFCEVYGWYSDGHCDESCAQPDPDCSSNSGGPGTPTVPGGPGNPGDPIDPGTPTDPDDPPVCEDPAWPRDYVAYGDDCDAIDFDCGGDWVNFYNECGCGCEEAQNGPSCENLDREGLVDYVSEDPDECARIRFSCPDGQLAFNDECGCGCIEPAGPVGPNECLDDTKADVDRIAGPQECQLIDFGCPEGWVGFEDECGCGCRLWCSDDFECDNGFCGEETACGTDAECPRHCEYPTCDDGTQLACRMVVPTCPDTDVVAVINGCYECRDARTCGPSTGP